MKVILGPASVGLGEEVAKRLGAEAIPSNFKKFPDGDSYVRIDAKLSGEHVCIVQTTYPVQDEKIMQLALLADAAKRSGARKVTAVVPYLAYARQDKSFIEGEAVSLETVMRMLSAAGVDGIITVNAHQEGILDKLPIRTKSVSAMPLLAGYFLNKGLSGAFSVAPDAKAEGMAREAAAVLKGGSGYFDKSRDRRTGEVRMELKQMDVRGRPVVIFDDMISTGGTIMAATRLLKEELGASKVCAACAHPLLAGDAEKRILASGVDEIVGTDSVQSGVSKVSLAALIADEIKKDAGVAPVR